MGARRKRSTTTKQHTGDSNCNIEWRRIKSVGVPPFVRCYLERRLEKKIYIIEDEDQIREIAGRRQDIVEG